jgi:hypothetical protein
VATGPLTAAETCPRVGPGEVLPCKLCCSQFVGQRVHSARYRGSVHVGCYRVAEEMQFPMAEMVRQRIEELARVDHVLVRAEPDPRAAARKKVEVDDDGQASLF